MIGKDYFILGVNFEFIVWFSQFQGYYLSSRLLYRLIVKVLMGMESFLCLL